MDAAQEIKNRLPIEELVASYCALQKKGRNFVALCPFHNDSHPSLLVSPDKGIAYCFACQSGGDIFSFYQKIESVDFPQALRDLGERTGVKVEDTPKHAIKKDEKDRLRDCLSSALLFFRDQLQSSDKAKSYLKERDVPAEQIAEFELGFAPDSFSETYEHLLKKGFSRREILQAGLGVQKELHEERIYDRFRNRLMFPIRDTQGNLAGFGGRTLGEDDAKYVNSSEGVLYHKSEILYGLHAARDAVRAKKNVLIVEGYFDLLACHRVGVKHVVATSGTALTEQHVKLLKRHVETVDLCLDADRAGQEAAERAFLLLSAQGLAVRTIVLPKKDASELLTSEPGLLTQLLTDGGVPYLDAVLDRIRSEKIADPSVRREILKRLIPLLAVLPFAVERKDYTAKAAAALGTTETALEEDLERSRHETSGRISVRTPVEAAVADPSKEFSKTEIALGLFFLYPRLRDPLLTELIHPEEPFPKTLYEALKAAPEARSLTVDTLELPAEHRERAGVLHLFCEEHFLEWSDSLAAREIRRNCLTANREVVRRMQEGLTRKLLAARAAKNATEEALLQNQYQQILKLRKIAG
ncbi:MAG: DNA primase [Candidatus Peribacteraceae bacterium]